MSVRHMSDTYRQHQLMKATPLSLARGRLLGRLLAVCWRDDFALRRAPVAKDRHAVITRKQLVNNDDDLRCCCPMLELDRP
jgi:hypothetical protein